MSRPTTATIDLAAIRHNYLVACQCAPKAQAIAVIKANAYGHGAAAIAKILAPTTPAFPFWSGSVGV